MRFTLVSASNKKISSFSLVWRYNACVSHACLHCLKRLLSFPLYGVKVHVFHTHLCIYLYSFRVFLGMGSQCMRFTRLSASIKTAFAFSLVWGHMAYVSYACLHVFRRILRFSSYRITMLAFNTLVCLY